MKNRLNITISDHLLHQIKKYAHRHNTSISQLVEDFFTRLTRPPKKKNILEVINDLPRPKLKRAGDLKQKYYRDQRKKYGF
jgi:hypothetical protein